MVGDKSRGGDLLASIRTKSKSSKESSISMHAFTWEHPGLRPPVEGFQGLNSLKGPLPTSWSPLDTDLLDLNSNRGPFGDNYLPGGGGSAHLKGGLCNHALFEGALVDISRRPNHLLL